MSVFALGLAAIVALAAMIHGAGQFQWSWFYPWVLAPYGLLMVIYALPRRQSRVRALAGALSAIVVTGISSAAYIQAMWYSSSSTSALVFVVMPVYLLVGGLLLWGLVRFLLGRLYRS